MKTARAQDPLQLPARDRILRTAHALFYREGIRATGIDRVIAEAGVTKVTFYRHFPSKNELILAFLAQRHAQWIAWFAEALKRHGSERKGIGALVPAMAEWLGDDTYRGCAFINSVGELAGTLPEAVDIAVQHKQEMAAIIAALLPPSRKRMATAKAIALAVDGAIVQAQIQQSPDESLRALERVVTALVAADHV
jgi:AcrR family transcriptional regulator